MSACCWFPLVLFLLGQRGEGSSNKSTSKMSLASCQTMRRHIFTQCLTGLLSKLSSVCLTEARAEEGQALLCFPSHDEEQSHDTPGDCPACDSPPLGLGWGQEGKPSEWSIRWQLGWAVFINPEGRSGPNWRWLLGGFPLGMCEFKAVLKDFWQQQQFGPQEKFSAIPFKYAYLQRYLK